MTIDKKPKINIHIQEMYDQVKKQGGPTGIFTQSIVDEFHRLVKLVIIYWVSGSPWFTFTDLD